METIVRERALALLEEQYGKKESLVLVYGRKGMGKTSLLQTFIQDKPALYFYATKELEGQCIRRFSKAVAEFCAPFGMNMELQDSWEGALEAFTAQGLPEKKILVIDEFHTLVKMNPGFLEIIRHAWITWLRPNGVMLILCGSLINIANELKAISPVYHTSFFEQTTLQLKVLPLRFTDLKGHLGELNYAQLVERFCVAGDSPAYLSCFLDSRPLMENIERHVLTRGSAFFDEPLLELERVTRESANYVSIMKVIAEDNHKLSEIYGTLNQRVNALSPYINNLIDLDLVVKRIPVTEPEPEKSRKGLYFIRDNFTAFWFTFVYPYISKLHLGQKEEVVGHIQKSLPASKFMRDNSYTICRDIFLWFCQSGVLDFKPGKTGAVWSSSELMLPLVSLDASGKRAFVAQCQYTAAGPAQPEMLESLKYRCMSIPGLSGKELLYGVFSYTGFDQSLINMAKRDKNVILVQELNLF